MSANTKSADGQATVTKIGRRLAGARVERGLTQAEVAERANATPGQVSEIESGKTRARLDTIARVAEAVGLELTLREPAA